MDKQYINLDAFKYNPIVSKFHAACNEKRDVYTFPVKEGHVTIMDYYHERRIEVLYRDPFDKVTPILIADKEHDILKWVPNAPKLSVQFAHTAWPHHINFWVFGMAKSWPTSDDYINTLKRRLDNGMTYFWAHADLRNRAAYVELLKAMI